ncbi:MFS transporter, partial [Streptomyces boncukensis]
MSDTHTSARAEAGPRPGTLVILLFISTLGMMGGVAIQPVIEVIRQSLGVGGTAGGLVLTAHGLAVAVASPLIGRLTDRVGPRLPLAAGLAVFGLAGGAGLFVDSYPALIASRLLLGVGIAAVFTCSTAALLAAYSGAERDRVMGWRTTAFTVGGVIYPLAAGALGNLSWHAPFAVYLIGLPLGAALLYTLPPGRPAGAGAEG